MYAMNKHLMLECGNPEEKSATFSRFVYPFAYRVQSREPAINDCQLRYVECGTVEGQGGKDNFFKSRREYFTYETSEVLFDSAKWLQIDLKGWKETPWTSSITFHCRGKEIAVSMLPPQLVLFEWPANDVNEADEKRDVEILQTGLLFVDLFFPEPTDPENHPEIDDLLVINDLFRYFRCPYEQHVERYGELLAGVPVEYKDHDAKKVGDGSVSDHEAYLNRWTELLEVPIHIEKGKGYSLLVREQDHRTYADNRAYVWSAAILKEGVKSLRSAFYCSNWEAHMYGHWIKLLNIDSPDNSGCPSKTHRNISQFEKKWAEARTYHRWEEGGTWYGFSYHSGVMFGGIDLGIPSVCHFRQMYFDIALLLFYMRISLFRFSRQLATGTPSLSENNDQKFRTFRELRHAFLRFTIRYQFPLLSNQQQAIEMYTLAREHFDIKELYEELKEEITNTHEFLEMVQQGKMSKDAIASAKVANSLASSAGKLAEIGIPVAAASLVASIFGMNAMDYPLLDWVGQSLDWVKSLIMSEGKKALSLRSPSVSFLVLICIVAVVGWKGRKLISKPIDNKKLGDSDGKLNE